MQRTPWQNALILTLFGAAIATACVVSSDDNGVDDEDGGSGGFGARGGNTSKGGEGGDDSKGGTTNVGGDTGNNGGDTSAGGSSGGTTSVTEIMCDPLETGGQGGGSMVVGTPYPDCEPVDADDACQVCIQENCCEAQKNCNAFEPNNVCGYGGPDEYRGNGGEFLCWQECVNALVEIPAGQGGAAGELPDTVDEQMVMDCLAECSTPDCGLYGDETFALAECVYTNCGDEVCFY
jgi:hypothetical protein